MTPHDVSFRPTPFEFRFKKKATAVGRLHVRARSESPEGARWLSATTCVGLWGFGVGDMLLALQRSKIVFGLC